MSTPSNTGYVLDEYPGRNRLLSDRRWPAFWISSVCAVVVFILCLASGLMSQTREPVESGWRGIQVFATPETEVTKSLGPAKKVDGLRESIYRVDGEQIVIRYSSEPCSTSLSEGNNEYTVARGTVVDMAIYFRAPKRLSELKWSQSEYNAGPGLHSDNNRIYYNKKRAIWIETHIEEGVEFVTLIWFRANEETRKKFACESLD